MSKTRICQNCLKESLTKSLFCPHCGSSFGEISYIQNGFKVEVKKGYRKELGEAKIEATYNGIPVVKIDDGAFSGFSSLSSLVIPDGIEEIGADAFSNCTSLSSLFIPSSIKRIGERAFKGCSSITEMILGNGMDALGGNKICFCANLASSRYNGGLGVFGMDLGICTCGANSIRVGLNKIEAEAFAGLTSLKSLTLPEGVKILGEGAFSYCSTLTEAKLPSSIDKLLYPFYGCPSLKVIKYNGTREGIKEISGYLSLLSGTNAYISCIDGDIKV